MAARLSPASECHQLYPLTTFRGRVGFDFPNYTISHGPCTSEFGWVDSKPQNQTRSESRLGDSDYPAFDVEAINKGLYSIISKRYSRRFSRL